MVRQSRRALTRILEPELSRRGAFIGAESAGDRAATLYTIIETAKLNNIDPEAYLRNLITRIASHPFKRIDKLLPWNVNL